MKKVIFITISIFVLTLKLSFAQNIALNPSDQQGILYVEEAQKLDMLLY